MGKKLKVHFMGINGSGSCPVAIIAKYMGYEVSGCDLNSSSYYSKTLDDHGIEVYNEHNISHIEDVDILAVSPAVLELSPNHPEIVEGKRRGILITWQEFLGEYLHRDKCLVSIAGTHGKSTTTVLMGATLENGGLDPIVEAGTSYRNWGSGVRLGESEYFVTEADEFNNNFLNYSPSIALINNVEMDHPEFFKDIDDVKTSFKNFIKKLKSPKILVVNEDSLALREILNELKDWLIQENVKIIGFYIHNKFDFPFDKEYKAEISSYNETHTSFKVNIDEKWHNFDLRILGEHNVYNSLGVLCVALELGVNIDLIKVVFEEFKGVGRRLDLLDTINNIKIYDDFAHHPTAIGVTLDSLRFSYKDSKIWAIFEPHQLSRTKLFFNEFATALKKADGVVVTKAFEGREANKNIEPVNLELLVKEIGTEKARYMECHDSISSEVVNAANPGDVIVIFGAGESYKLSRAIVEELREKYS